MEEQTNIYFLLKYKLSEPLFQQWQHSHQAGVMMQYIIKT